MLLFLFSYPVQRYSFMKKGASFLHNAPFVYLFIIYAYLMITSSFFTSYSRPGTRFFRTDMAPERVSPRLK